MTKDFVAELLLLRVANADLLEALERVSVAAGGLCHCRPWNDFRCAFCNAKDVIAKVK